MKRFDHLSVSRFRPLVLLFLIGLLAACRGGEEPALVMPTPLVTTEPGVLPTVAATAEAPTIAPTTISQATATFPPPPTIAPPLPTSTAGPGPTATPLPATATPIPTVPPVAATGGYRVAFVTADDVLNVRRQPGSDTPVVLRLPPDATGITLLGEGESIRGGALWLPIETGDGFGWVNSRFLTEDVSHEMFCGDPAVAALLDQLQTAVAEEDGRLLEELIHPDRGLRVRLNWWNPEVIIEGDDVRQLFRADTRHEWGTEDGSGRPIRGSFAEIVLPRLEQDLLGAGERRCDEGLFGPTAGLTNLPEGYEAVRFYSIHRPAPAEQEMDWGTWLVGVERWEGQYYLSYLVHYRWEI